MYGIDANNILRGGTPVYLHEPGNGGRFATGSASRGVRHVATVIRPIRDYGRDTASYYELRLWDGRERVASCDFIELRFEGKDAR